jgi:mono/diheme cytochrome c family protein
MNSSCSKAASSISASLSRGIRRSSGRPATNSLRAILVAMRRSLLLLPLVVLAGCGGGSTGGGGAKTPAQTFAGTCGSCHTLKAAGTSGTFGPNLDELKPDVERVKAAIASGPGGMPAGLLEGDKAEQIAAYVANSAGD